MRDVVGVEDADSGLTDAELLGRGPAGFVVVYDRHAAAVFGWAQRRVGGYAADLAAEVFARAWQSRRRFRDRGDGSALPWLIGIARNVLRGSLRRQRIESGARERLGLPSELTTGGYDAIEQRLSLPEAVVRAWASLPESERAVLVLRVIEDRPYREIAERLDCTPVAARLRVSRSLRRLRLAMEAPTP